MQRRTALFFVVLLTITLFSNCNCSNKQKVTITFNEDDPMIAFACGDIQQALKAKGYFVEKRDISQLDSILHDTSIILSTIEDNTMVSRMLDAGVSPSSTLKPEGFSLRTTTDNDHITYWVIGADAAGAMYGGLELAEVIDCEGLAGVQDVDQNPYMALRGTKYNCPLDQRTPTYSNHNGDAQVNNVLVMWDIDFWKEYIDTLARYRYNYISLWNLHPFPSMVRVPGYEKVALDDVQGATSTKKITMDEKIAFWREVMRYGKDRNVDFYVITWNIFVHGTKDQYGLTDDYDNPITTDYFRKSIKQMFLTYPDLAGMGVTTGENMPNMSTQQKENWALATYGQGVLDAARELPGRKITFFHRQHQTGATQVAATFQPLVDHPDIEFIFSFKYAKAHVFSSTTQTYHHGFVNDIKGRNLKTIWTLRNDDNFYFRWGAPDFVREFIQNIPYDVSRGYYYGSDGYVWGHEFLSTEHETPRQLDIIKHWYHWMLWGRLGYDPTLSNERFTKILGTRFPQVAAESLFTAWQEASMIYPKTTGFHWGSLDFQWYIEGCISRSGPAQTDSGFHDINRFITLGTHPGTDYVDIPDYVDDVMKAKQTSGTTPVEISDQLHQHADTALQILDTLDHGGDKELRRTLGDIRAISYLGKYYAHKIRGATELTLFRRNQNAEHSSTAVKEMTQAASYWDLYTTTALNQYTNPILLNRVGLVDWLALRKEVQKDITIAGGEVTQEMPPEDTVLFIRNPNSARAQHDRNIISVLGEAGITIDGTVIPGLGLGVRTIDPASLEEAETYTAAHRALILISDTVSSGNVANHADDPLPVVCMESILFESGMFFCTDSGNINDIARMEIVDTGHPITSVFDAGEIRFSKQSGDSMLGTLQGDLAAGITILAHNPNNNNQPCLVVLDKGDSPLLSGGPSGYDPAPARRVCLGYQQNAFANPTVDGVILLQRVIQWAMNEPVTVSK